MPGHSRLVADDLTDVPDASVARSVTARPVEMAGRRALRVELTDKIAFDGRPGVDYVDQPTFLVLPAQFTNGTIEVGRYQPPQRQRTSRRPRLRRHRLPHHRRR